MPSTVQDNGAHQKFTVTGTLLIFSFHTLSLQFVHASEDEGRILHQTFKNTVLRSDKSVRKYTGMLSKKILYGWFEIIQKKVASINYWKGPKQCKNNSQPSRQRRNKKGREFNEYLMTLIYIREAMEKEVLADLFGVSLSHVSCVITTWINVLYEVFRKQLKYPSAETVKKNLPEHYPSKYRDTRIILDCTEFFTVRPRNCTAQAVTYSTYKHHNTLKL